MKAFRKASSRAATPLLIEPRANPQWNSAGPVVCMPQKAPLIVLSDRPLQIETPRNYFRTVFTSNEAFFVRWHLQGNSRTMDLRQWRLQIKGNVNRAISLSLTELMQKFEPVSVAAVSQCSGNSRSRMEPRVPGAQWGNGAMGNAMWTGVRLVQLLDIVGIRRGSLTVQFEGLEQGKRPNLGSSRYLKSLDLENPALKECIVAYLMNGEAIPMLNGFPVRLVVPGFFATYWVKCLTWIRVQNTNDEGFWMKTGYRVPDTRRGHTTPAEVEKGRVKMVPIERLPVRSFLISPDGSSKVPAGMSVTLRGIAFSGFGHVKRVEVSEDGGRSWKLATLGKNYGTYSFRTWEASWSAESPGRYSLAVRATDAKNNVQLNEPVWNPGGYLWNRIERQEIVVG
jgi:DMSO/TMAO reductase YedYZ molybdopterin-dependent catalytic subunit